MSEGSFFFFRRRGLELLTPRAEEKRVHADMSDGRHFVIVPRRCRLGCPWVGASAGYCLPASLLWDRGSGRSESYAFTTVRREGEATATYLLVDELGLEYGFARADSAATTDVPEMQTAEEEVRYTAARLSLVPEGRRRVHAV